MASSGGYCCLLVQLNFVREIHPLAVMFLGTKAILTSCFTVFLLPGVMLKGVRESDKQQKESPPVESQGSEQIPLCSKLSEKSLGMAGSTPSARLGQWFMSKGLSM